MRSIRPPSSAGSGQEEEERQRQRERGQHPHQRVPAPSRPARPSRHTSAPTVCARAAPAPGLGQDLARLAEHARGRGARCDGPRAAGRLAGCSRWKRVALPDADVGGPPGPGSGNDSGASSVSVPRSTRSVAAGPRCVRPARPSSADQVVTGAPSTRRCGRPGGARARAAGEPGSTAPITVPSGWWVPAMKRPARSTHRRSAQLPSGPAAKMASRRPGDRARRRVRPEGFVRLVRVLPLQPEPAAEGQGADGPPLAQRPETEERGADAEGEDDRPGPEHPRRGQVGQLVHGQASPPRARSARSARMRAAERSRRSPPLEKPSLPGRRGVPRLGRAADERPTGPPCAARRFLPACGGRTMRRRRGAMPSTRCARRESSATSASCWPTPPRTSARELTQSGATW